MKMSVMRYDGLQGQPFWMQNDQLANSPQFCLKTSAILDTSRRNSQRNFSLHEDQLASLENMQSNDSPFNDDIDNDNLKGTKSGKRRHPSSNHITRQKLLRLSGLETESKHLASSPFSDCGENKSHSEDDDERVNLGSVRPRMLSGENQLRREEGAVDMNNCDMNSEMDDTEMEAGNEDIDNVEDDENLNALEEEEEENLRRNNGVELNIDNDSNNFDGEFERDCPSGKGGNSEDESGLVSARNKILFKQESGESEACNASERRHSIANSITRLSQAMLDAKANNNVSSACSSGSSRRNKRKNFKPRNIIYQYDVCEDGENELIDDYQLALSNWEMSSQQQKNPLRDSPNVRTSSESPPPVSSKEEEEENGRARETDQPLDLSDNASLTEQVKEEPSTVYHKHHSRKQKTRRYPGPSESRNSKSQNTATTTTGAAMDLTMTSRTDDEKSVNLSNKFIFRGGTSSAMDLSSGNFASVYNAMSNYATGLTTVLASSEYNSASATTNSDQSNVNTNTGAGNSSNARSLTSLPKIPPMVRSGITASLLDLVAAGGPSSPSKRNAKAAAAAAAAHAAAISLAQAVRDREEGNSDGPGGILSALPPNLDVSSIKDYAESTMKELLGLYGFNDMVESLNKDSVSNYFSADMLESMSNTLGLLPSRVSLLPSLLPRSMPPSSMQSSTSRNSPPLSYQGKSNLNSGRTGQMNSSNTTPSPTDTIPSTSAQPQINEDMFDSLHNQVVGGMAKLANLPSGNVVGNPRAILPSNVSSILSLAAMQKNKQADVPSSSPSPTPNFTPKSSVSTAPSRARNSSSGMTSGIFQDQRKSTPIDYSRYVKRYVKMRLLRFSSSAECGNNSCKDLNYREHFHCLDCNSRVFIKKEEMIRHFKWHKKRDESLQHGFLRYSPMDDCSEKFPNCAHNRKQTHYHCLMYKDGCDKCYISTSDVQMHANYHRKDSAIIQEGFQRFRATEDCGLSICAFSGQRTTHFHCRRSGCNFTFKNKADMEKHKTYHIKDEQLNKDGFKKFMKHECCNFESCRFSRVCNHIHCIRPGCNYVLHSSGQLYSHKRKHERRDNEMAYRKFKLAQSMMRSIGDNQGLSMQSMGDDIKHGDSLPPPSSSPGPSVCSPSSSSGLPSIGLPSSTSSLTTDNAYNSALQQSFSKYSAMLEAASANGQIDSSMAPYGFAPGNDPFSLLELSADFLKARSDDSWRKYLSRFTANDPCKTNCDFIYKDHYHCNAENCTMVFRSKDGVREHARNHELQDQVTDAFYSTVDGGAADCCPADCPYQNKQRHYHCGWQNCRETILAVDKPFRRLDHYKMHEFSHKLNFSKEPVPLNITSCSSIDGIFRRKRGRPPKNRTVEFPVSSGSSEYPQAIYTSFKLPKLNHMTGPGGGGDNLPSPYGNMGSSSLSKNLSPGAQTLVSGQMSPIMMSNKAYPKLSLLQPHLQKHLNPSASEMAKNLQSSCSDDEFSDRAMEDEDDDGDGLMNSQHIQDSSDDSDSSSNRFAPSNYRHSSPSADSTPSSHNQSYGPFTGAVNHLANDLLHTFPHVADHLQMNPLANFLNPGGVNIGSAMLPQDFRVHSQAMAMSSSLHPNGSGGHMEINAGEHSSPASTPPGSGAASSVESYGSNPSSPHLQYANQKHFSAGSSNHLDIHAPAGGDDLCETKKGKMTGLRLLRDEPVPEGYIRYRFNEDCRYTHCGYREHQTHFHCMRKDCGYSFCDKTRFVQHTARHERLDTLMGGDFQQFRAQVACGRSECVYITAPGHLANKASHFHCLKCEFVCTDTNKVVAHRRQHQKLDSITAAGFEKYSAQQSCNNEGCSHNQRQTHYHCVKCQYSVMGLSQMSAHKYRHLEGQ